MIESRRHLRLSSTRGFPAFACRLSGNGGKGVAVIVLDVSASGIGFMTDDPLEPGTVVAIDAGKVTGRAGKLVHGRKAVVKWVKNDRGGAEFETPLAADDSGFLALLEG